jgi:phage tail protein X
MTHPDILAALKLARDFIHTDMVSAADCCTGPDGTMEPEDGIMLAEYDQALQKIDAAIALGESDKHVQAEPVAWMDLQKEADEIVRGKVLKMMADSVNRSADSAKAFCNHTPGPWRYGHLKGADGLYRTEVFSDEHGGIASCHWTPKHCGDGVTETYREANARLIAAAPDLLEALQVVLRDYTAVYDIGDVEMQPALYQARAAIAKATGEKT